MNPGKKKSILLLSLVAIPTIVIIGWLFNIEVFKRFSHGFAAMNPMTAFTFMLAALALLLIRYDDKKYILNVVNFLALCIVVIGLLRLISYVSIYDVEIDDWLFPGKTTSGISGLNSRIAPNTAVSFVISGIGLFLLNIQRHRAFLADYAALFTAFIGLLSMTGYIYQANEFYEMKTFYPMAFPTAICFILLSLAIFSYKKESGFAEEITSKSGGRQIAALLIPVAIIVPFLLGYLRLQSDKTGYFSPSFSTALVSITGTVISVFFIWMISASVNRLNRSLVKEIEARKRVENELIETNLFLNTILEHTPGNIFVKDAKELRYISINKATEKFLRSTKDEIIGKTDYEIFSKEEADFIRNIDLQVLHQGKLVLTEEQRLHRGNEVSWMSTKKIPVKDINRNPLYIIGIAEDITEQKNQQEQIKQFNKDLEKKVLERTEQLGKSEKRFRSLIENGVDVIKMMTGDGVIFFASRSNKRVLGFSPEEMVRTNWLSYVHPEERNNGVALIEKALATPSVPVQGSFRLLHKEGHYISAEGSITNFLHDESVNALVCNFHDITERLRIENEKLLLEKALTAEKINRQRQITRATIEGQEKERTAIAMELHDNINQMLGVIKLYIGMAIKVPATTKEMLDKSHENIVLCITEIKKLSKKLAIPNLERGLFNAIADLIENFGRGSEINFSYFGDDGILQKVSAIKQLAFYRIVQELLTNVIKHAEAKNVCISFKESEGEIVLSFKDDGKGFNTDTINKGLGLQNIQNRVEVLNGTFEMASEENKGSKVIVTVPKD